MTELKRIQQRRDTAAKWTENNPVLLSGEIGIETDTQKGKIGDGTTAWNNLPYSMYPETEMQEYTYSKADIDNTITEIEDQIADVADNIPTKTSEITNDSGYVTDTQVYSKQEIDQKIGEISGDIPTVGNGVLTIKRNNRDLGTFSANTATNTTVDVQVPTKTSELVNDSGFSTFDGNYNSLNGKPTIPTKTSDLANDSGYITGTNYYTKQEVNNKISEVAGDIPTVGNGTVTINQGGTVKGTFTMNQSGNTTINLEAGGGQADSVDWADVQNKPSFATVATSGSYNDLSDKPTIPVLPTLATVATSGSYNDLSDKPTIPVLPTLATVATSGSYNDLTNKPTIPDAPRQSDWNQTNSTLQDYIKNKPTIPTKTSELTNDSGYTTFSGDYNDLTNKPTIPVLPTLATVATSGNYNDLTDKPTIPTVNNATLTIQKNGTTVDTFTANASTNKTVNITVPSTTEDWSFLLADGTTVTKSVYIE